MAEGQVRLWEGSVVCADCHRALSEPAQAAETPSATGRDGTDGSGEPLRIFRRSANLIALFIAVFGLLQLVFTVVFAVLAVLMVASSQPAGLLVVLAAANALLAAFFLFTFRKFLLAFTELFAGLVSPSQRTSRG